MNLYAALKERLQVQIKKHHLSGRKISVRCKALSPAEAIGTPEHDDYPIIKGREVMVEADFFGAKGQAFADEFENADYFVEDLLEIKLESNKKRASFISGINAIFRYLNLCDQTIHCKDAEPKTCASHLVQAIGPRQKVLLVGHQPRFLEILSAQYPAVRVLDLDPDNIGTRVNGVVIEPPEMRREAMKWSDFIFATGSTLVNGTADEILNKGKPVLFYGVTIAAAASLLNLDRFCYCGH